MALRTDPTPWLLWTPRNVIGPREPVPETCRAWPINSVWRNYPPWALEATGWTTPTDTPYNLLF